MQFKEWNDDKDEMLTYESLIIKEDKTSMK